jgi:hypothetical protein
MKLIGDELRQVVDDYLHGKMEKIQALSLLEFRYKQADLMIQDRSKNLAIITYPVIRYQPGGPEKSQKEIFEIYKREVTELSKCYDECKAAIENGNRALEEAMAGTVTEAPEKPEDDGIDSAKNNFFMLLLKNSSPATYSAMLKALETGLVTFDNKLFDFHCAIGCVGLFFAEGGFTENKTISRHILINSSPINVTALKNGKKNTPPKEWESIKSRYFD